MLGRQEKAYTAGRSVNFKIDGRRQSEDDHEIFQRRESTTHKIGWVFSDGRSRWTEFLQAVALVFLCGFPKLIRHARCGKNPFVHSDGFVRFATTGLLEAKLSISRPRLH